MGEAYTVLEIAGSATAPCGRLLAEAGAEVILVEPPGGAPSRQREPFLGPAASPVSAYALFHDRGKRSLTLDLDADAGRAAFRDLVATADVVLESDPPGTLARRGLDYAALAALQPRLVLVSITPFGQDGPYRDYVGGDFVTFALGGLMFISGEPGRPPVVAPEEQAVNTAATHAALATLAALWGRDATGAGDWIDVSAFECLAAQENTLTNYLGPGRFTRRNGSQHRTALPGRVFPCADGYVHLYVGRETGVWTRFLEWLGHPPELADPTLDDINARWEQAAVVDAVTERFTRARSRATLFDSAQALHLPCVPVYSPADYLADAHTTARGVVIDATHPVLGPYRALRPPLELGAPPPARRVSRESAPPPPGRRGPEAMARPPVGRGAPLAGVRVVAFTHVAAGPYGCLQLAYLGAEVVKVESATRIDSWRYRDRNDDPEASRPFADHNKNVRSVTLDLKHPEGVALARRLIAASDAVVDNYSVGVMDRLGLGYDDVRRDNPGVIVLHMAGLGATGPRRHYVTFGPSIMSFSGVSYLWNHPDQEVPVGSQSSYPDYLVGVYAAYAVVAALHRRARSGEGQLLDLAQAEAMAQGLGPAMLAALNGAASVEPRGNTGAGAPQGCYPCAPSSGETTADDAWCAVAVTTDAQWAGLRRAMGEPSWAAAREYATADGRRAHRAALDASVAAWTRQHTPRVVMERCQSEGVPAGMVATGEDLAHDPQLAGRGFMLEREHPRLGWQRMPGPGVRFQRAEVPVWRFGPLLGEDTDTILSTWLDLSDPEIRGYRERGALR